MLKGKSLYLDGTLELDPQTGVLYITLYPEPKDSEPTGQQIVDAVGDLVIAAWENCPIEPRNEMEYDS